MINQYNQSLNSGFLWFYLNHASLMTMKDIKTILFLVLHFHIIFHDTFLSGEYQLSNTF